VNHITWSATEKKIARAAFDTAYQRECEAIRRELHSMLNSRKGAPDVIHNVEQYLSNRLRELTRKYDYRYSVLMLVFMQLFSQGWLTDDDMEGLAQEKIDMIKQPLSR
jgi:hypothetical protein